MFERFVFAAFALLASFCLCGVIWWIVVVVRTWRDSHRKTAVSLFLVPTVALSASLFVDSSAFSLVLLIGAFVSVCHMVITVWRRGYKKAAVGAALVGFVFIPLALGGVVYSLMQAQPEKLGMLLDSTRHHAPETSAVVGINPPGHHAPDLVKQECESLVEGQLLFMPSTTMRQGQTYPVFARLSRGNDTQIMSGLDGKGIIIENSQVSCMVSMTLDFQEEDGFKIEKVPADRPDEQILVANSYTQWDWRVTPLKSGTLHLRLWVTPKLFVDGIGQGLKQFPQPPRVITVSPDRVYAITHFILTSWAVWGSLLTAIVIPLFLWLLRQLKSWTEERPTAKKAGF